jgi:hypothetical protein
MRDGRPQEGFPQPQVQLPKNSLVALAKPAPERPVRHPLALSHRSAKGTDAYGETAKELPTPLRGALDSVTVLRGFPITLE